MIIHQFRHTLHKIGWLRLKVHDTHQGFLDHIGSITEWNPANPPMALWHGMIRPRGYWLGEMHVPITAPLEDVAHECTHVACSAYRRTYGWSVDLGDTTQRPRDTDEDHYADPEERLAYILGGYADMVIGACLSIGMFSGPEMAD